VYCREILARCCFGHTWKIYFHDSTLSGSKVGKNLFRYAVFTPPSPPSPPSPVCSSEIFPSSREVIQSASFHSCFLPAFAHVSCQLSLMFPASFRSCLLPGFSHVSCQLSLMFPASFHSCFLSAFSNYIVQASCNGLLALLALGLFIMYPAVQYTRICSAKDAGCGGSRSTVVPDTFPDPVWMLKRTVQKAVVLFAFPKLLAFITSPAACLIKPSRASKLLSKK